MISLTYYFLSHVLRLFIILDWTVVAVA